MRFYGSNILFTQDPPVPGEVFILDLKTFFCHAFNDFFRYSVQVHGNEEDLIRGLFSHLVDAMAFAEYLEHRRTLILSERRINLLLDALTAYEHEGNDDDLPEDLQSLEEIRQELRNYQKVYRSDDNLSKT